MKFAHKNVKKEVLEKVIRVWHRVVIQYNLKTFSTMIEYNVDYLKQLKSPINYSVRFEDICEYKDITVKHLMDARNCYNILSNYIHYGVISKRNMLFLNEVYKQTEREFNS